MGTGLSEHLETRKLTEHALYSVLSTLVGKLPKRIGWLEMNPIESLFSQRNFSQAKVDRGRSQHARHPEIKTEVSTTGEAIGRLSTNGLAVGKQRHQVIPWIWERGMALMWTASVCSEALDSNVYGGGCIASWGRKRLVVSGDNLALVKGMLRVSFPIGKWFLNFITPRC